MYNDYASNYGTSPFMNQQPFYSPGMQWGFNSQQSFIPNGLNNSIDFFSRLAQNLSATSEAIHFTFSSAIRLITAFRALSSDFESFGDAFSLLNILRSFIAKLKNFVYQVLGLPLSNQNEKQNVTEKTTQNVNLANIKNSPVKKFVSATADRFLLFSLIYALISLFKKLFLKLIEKLAACHGQSLRAFTANGQSVEVKISPGVNGEPSQMTAFLNDGQCCKVVLNEKSDFLNENKVKNLAGNVLENKSENTFENIAENPLENAFRNGLENSKGNSAEIEMILPNGSHLPLYVRSDQKEILQEFLKQIQSKKIIEIPEPIDNLANNASNSNKKKSQDFPTVGFYENASNFTEN